MLLKNQIAKLSGQIQHYNWGGNQYIPALLGFRPKPGKKYAEYWMGAHKKAPSLLHFSDGTMLSLDEAISNEPEVVLGPTITEIHGRLPFLFKVLDVQEMLSIQVHPTKAQAIEGFERENALGIPRDSPTRNYRDNNHKPEIMVALGEFWLLHGFRSITSMKNIFKMVPEFKELSSLFEWGGYQALYEAVMEMPFESMKDILAPLKSRLSLRFEQDLLSKSSPDYWAARAFLNQPGKEFDRGVFSIYFLNLVKLEPGEGIFQDARVPHAYLNGQNIELMANSDNVLRAGITEKHVDAGEFMRVTKFESVTPRIIPLQRINQNVPERVYPSPNDDFELVEIELAEGNVYRSTSRSAEILLCMRGESKLSTKNTQLCLRKGGSAFIRYGTNYQLFGLSSVSRLFRAATPVSY